MHVAGWTCYLAALGLSKVEGVPANVANDLSTGLGPAFICFPPVEMSMNPIFACGAQCMISPPLCFGRVTMGHMGYAYIIVAVRDPDESFACLQNKERKWQHGMGDGLHS